MTAFTSSVVHPHLVAALAIEPPTTLYHYTDQEGLLGILKERRIWATHTRYLNDHAEFLHAIELFRELAPVVAANTSNQREQEHLEALARKAANFEHGSNVCVTSFSEDGDSLPQWRAYGRPGSAFAIGFYGEELAALAAREEVILAKCVYADSEHRELISALINECLARAVEMELTAAKMKHTKALTLLNRYAPILKNWAFHNEAEWRLVAQPVKPVALEFRAGKSTVIPYRPIPLGAARIERIVIGPTPNAPLAVAAVKSLLERHEYFGAGVEMTKAPFRDW